jgi:3-oxoadipate enol-lactonase/4-carboxymuconolactone decarboxylase
MIVIPRAAHMVVVVQAEMVNGYLGAFLARGDRRDAALTGGVGFEVGLVNRKGVLGHEHVERTRAAAGEFGGPWQDFITRVAWGEVWGDPTLPWKTRSLVTLAVMATLNREQEFKLHVRPALANGVSLDELKSLLLQVGVYAGDPAGNSAMRWLRDVLGEELP